jgi:hypothetical protein
LIVLFRDDVAWIKERENMEEEGVSFTEEGTVELEIIDSSQEVCILKAMLHGAIFLATCNAILLLRDVN